MVTFNFKKKHCEEKFYNKLKKRLIKNGYKPLSEPTISYSFTVKKRKYPFQIHLRI